MNTVARQLIPDPYDSYEQQERYYHRDLARLTAARLWAEQVLLTGALAELVFTETRPRAVAHDAQGNPTTDLEWLRERIEQVKSETIRRQRKDRAA